MGTLVKTVKQELFRVSFGGPMSPRHTRRILAAAVSATLAASGAAVANTVDGTVSAGEYTGGSVLQNNATGFGNNQSEPNGAYWNYAPGGNLELAIPGNLESSGR